MLRQAAKRKQEKCASEVKELTKTDHAVNLHPEAIPLGTTPYQNEEEWRVERQVLGGEDEILEKLAQTVKPLSQKKKNAASINAVSRRPAWDDPDDLAVVKVKRKKKKDAKWSKAVEEISGQEYINKLKAQFENVTSGTPSWAKLPSERQDLSDEDSDVDQLLTSTGTYLATSSALSSGALQIKRCRDANAEAPSKGRLSKVQFHPSAQVLMTASIDASLRFFQVDGKNNPKIQSVFLDNFPIMSASFSAGGLEVIMGSRHCSFYWYDMMAGKVVFVPKIKGLGERNMARLKVTPDGQFIVFLGDCGQMHLLSGRTKEWIHTFKMNGTVEDVAFSADGCHMYSTGGDGQVYIWDLKTRDCIHHFVDDGCVHGTCLALSSDSQYLACGSNTGVVNIYNTKDCLSSASHKPLKSIMNLTTSCTSSVFNPSTEILGLASNFTEKAIKLVHLPSLTVFSNFPEFNDTKLHIPWTMDFSVNSGYMAVGNHKGNALLYRLQHYGSY
ncbi:U3 small nucleolar RNA-associated protein 18 homolog [Pomacea canaliculata]|uniref:U3 small nucleolar RNA-associated protein 18 homolog n=1 Tax=Pomacea canaliculata TaxID=400727 RepID=UPI000D73A526|nr:U3 small nucleolar RNA-associated protein 18 homolog [Pomacea canaliculata]